MTIQESRGKDMDVTTRVQVASAEGIALGLLVQLDYGIRLTPKGMAYGDKLFHSFSDLDCLILAGYLKRATPEAI